MHRSDDNRTCAAVRGEVAWHSERTTPGRQLVRVKSGVATGTACRVQGNVRAEWWTFLVSHEQVEASLSMDPLRFEDPLLFERFQRELDHAFSSSTPRLGTGLRSRDRL